jgi:palmitoyltransferase
MTFGFILFTGYLLIYHTMLIVSGITTWEHMKKDRITYLKYLPPGYNPFSHGPIQNIITFFK